VDAVRKVELRSLVKSNQIRGFNLAFNFASGPLMAFLCFLTFELLGNSLTAENVFATIGYLNTMKIPMALFFPIAIQVCTPFPAPSAGAPPTFSMYYLHFFHCRNPHL